MALELAVLKEWGEYTQLPLSVPLPPNMANIPPPPEHSGSWHHSTGSDRSLIPGTCQMANPELQPLLLETE